MKSKVLITGGSGFVGQALIASGLFADAIYLSRRDIPGVKNLKISELNTKIDYTEILENVDIVVHCAGIAHNSDNSTLLYNSFNADFTQHLAKQAAQSKVKQFVFISTAKVLGEETTQDKPFNITSVASPKTLYSKSKFLAEQYIISEVRKSSMSYTIIRPPLIYGPEPKGNLKTLSKLIKYKIPLPVAKVCNRRSMISIYDLVEFIHVCCSDKKSWGKKYLLSDGVDYSTEYLIKLFAGEQKIKARTFWVPKIILKVLFFIFRKQNIFSSVYGSFELEVEPSRNMLGWKPSRKLADFKNSN